MCTRFAAGVASLALLGSIASTGLPAAAHPSPAQPAVVASYGADASDCGSIVLGSTDAATLKGATDCLQHAFSSCTNAQLLASWDNATEKVDRVITVASGGDSCQILDTVTKTTKATGADANDTYRCNNISADASGITIRGCGADGDIAIKTS
jgi:hypothetical protein